MASFLKQFPFRSQQQAPANRPAIEDYLNQINPSVRESLTAYQLSEIQRVLSLAVPKPAPKLIDLRFEIDVIISRYFVVLLVGKDRRQSRRNYPTSRLTHWVNVATAVLLLVGFNLVISGTVLMLMYLTKSALGIDLLPGHFRGSFK